MKTNRGLSVLSSDAVSSDALSYAYLRKVVGTIGTALPVILLVGLVVISRPTVWPASISAYYYTAMSGVFVGSLCAIGVFLLSYRDYGRTDDIASTLACLFVLGVALFPTSPASPTQGGVYAWVGHEWIGRLHIVCATLFFMTMAYFCLYLFPKMGKEPTKEKMRRNRVYLMCGIVIVGCIALLFLNAFIPLLDVSALQLWLKSHAEWVLVLAGCRVYLLESIAVMAFGFSWLVKGGALLADKQSQPASSAMGAQTGLSTPSVSASPEQEAMARQSSSATTKRRIIIC